ncbi:ganglioside GM2 activator-like [Rhinoraja longicauda]
MLQHMERKYMSLKIMTSRLKNSNHHCLEHRTTLTTNSLNAFHWEDCNANQGPVKIKSISVAQDPIMLPGNITFEMSGQVESPLTGMKAKVKLYKKIFFWWPIPCQPPLQCDFDVCELMNRKPFCSINNENFNYLKSEYEVFKLNISRFLINGNYSANVILSSGGKQVACVNVYFSLKAV